MEMRSLACLQASFASSSATLDEAVRIVRRELDDPDAQVVDRSNRSGFDKSGFWHFSYDVKLECRRGTDPVERAYIWLSYIEPLGQGEEARIEVLCVAARQNPGTATSQLRRSDPCFWHAPRVPPPDAIAAEILQRLHAAWAHLATSS